MRDYLNLNGLKIFFTELKNLFATKSDLTSGDVVVSEAAHAASADKATTATNANHATSADSATKATTADTATTATSATTAGSATKATQDGSGNVITTTYETKSDASKKLTEAKEYAEELVADEVTARDSAIATAKSSAISIASSDATSKADAALASAKTYTDTKTSGLASTSTVDSKISTHNTSTSAHSDIRTLITDLTTKLNKFLDVDDATTDQLSEVLTLIENNKGTLESLTSNKVNVSDIIDNLTTANKTKVLSANQGVAIKALIDALQAAVDGKVSTSTLNNYYTKTQVDSLELITVADIDSICVL